MGLITRDEILEIIRKLCDYLLIKNNLGYNYSRYKSCV